MLLELPVSVSAFLGGDVGTLKTEVGGQEGRCGNGGSGFRIRVGLRNHRGFLMNDGLEVSVMLDCELAGFVKQGLEVFWMLLAREQEIKERYSRQAYGSRKPRRQVGW